MFYHVTGIPIYLNLKTSEGFRYSAHNFYFKWWSTPYYKQKSYLSTRMQLIMPRKKQQAQKQQSFQNFEFADVPIAGKDKPMVETWFQENEPDYFTMLDTLFEEGYSVKLRYSSQTASHVASIIGSQETVPNDNIILTGHAETSFEALGIVLYKHFVLSDAGEWSRQTTDGRWG